MDGKTKGFAGASDHGVGRRPAAAGLPAAGRMEAQEAGGASEAGRMPAENEPQQDDGPPRDQAGPVIKALLLLTLILGSIALFHYTPLGEWLNPAAIEALVGRAGSWGPVIFIAIYALGICLFLPASFFSSIGAVLFGPYLGYLCNLSGALIGSAAAFFISRYLGREFISRLLGHRLQKYDDKIARNGFATTLYLRLIYFPFTPLNFGLGLTRISFRAYFFGTMLGILTGGFVLTFFFATLGAAWKAGDWGVLLSGRAAIAATLFCISFVIPTLVKKSRLFKEQEIDERVADDRSSKDAAPREG